MVTVEHLCTKLKTVLCNQMHPPTMNTANKKGIHPTLNVEQWENITGGNSGENPPLRQVLSTTHEIIQPLCDKNTENKDQQCLTKDKRKMEVMIPILSVKLTIEERVNMHSNNSRSEEQPLEGSNHQPCDGPSNTQC